MPARPQGEGERADRPPEAPVAAAPAQDAPPTDWPTRTAAPGGAPSLEPLPALIGRSQVRGRLGRGGMGTVYQAHDPLLARPVAVKVPHLDRADAPARQRFLREARAAASLRHPHVCPIYDVGEEGDTPYV